MTEFKSYTKKGKMNHDDVVAKISSMYNGDYELVGEYNGTSKPITLRYKPTGEVYTTTKANRFLNEGRALAPSLSKSNISGVKRSKRTNWKSMSEDDLSKLIEDTRGEDYKYVSGWVEGESNRDTPIIVNHSVYGEYKSTPRQIIDHKSEPPALVNLLRGPKVKDGDKYLSSILDEAPDGNLYSWLDKYTGDNKERLRIKYLPTGKVYKYRPNDFQYGNRPRDIAGIGSSHIENNIYEFVKNNTDLKVIQHDRHVISPKEIDIYVPEINLGIEFNGSYWHSDKVLFDKNAHLLKLESAKEQGISLIFIDEVDWINPDKQPIIKDMILYKLRSSNIKSVYARKLQFKEISAKDRKNFFNENHLQGDLIASYNFGLVDTDDNILAAISFVKPRISTNNSKSKDNWNPIELARFADKRGYHIPGGFSKLLKNAEKVLSKDSYTHITTFADRSISNGNVYKKNGFTLHHISKPSYFYIRSNKKINRFTLRKSNLKELLPEEYSDDKTEFQIIDDSGKYLRVWNTGNFVYHRPIE